MRTLITIFISLVVLFFVGYFNYYIPKEEKEAVMNSPDRIMMSSLRYGFLVYLSASLAMLAVTLLVYFRYDYANIGINNTAKGVIVLIIMMLHVIAFFILACVYCAMPIISEFVAEQRAIRYYARYFGIIVMDDALEVEEED